MLLANPSKLSVAIYGNVMKSRFFYQEAVEDIMNCKQLECIRERFVCRDGQREISIPHLKGKLLFKTVEKWTDLDYMAGLEPAAAIFDDLHGSARIATEQWAKVRVGRHP